MPQLRTILYPTDFSPCAEKAFEHALLLTRAFQARLILFHAVVMFQETIPVPEVEGALEKLYSTLEDRAASRFPETGAGIEVERVVARGISAAEEIVGFAEQNDVDLVVMGTHGRRHLAHLFLGSVTERVLHSTKRSVLCVREEAKPVSLGAGYRTIVTAIDFSEHSRKAALWAGTLADRFGSELHFVHVVEDSIHPAYYLTGKTSLTELIPEIRPKSQEAMQKLAAELGLDPARVHVVVREGNASSEIAKYCREADADLLCTGTRGLRGLESVLLGGTAERLARSSPCAVLVVK
ncbi:MAG: universal stress protein [candidate division KSB1 bacterium]|nr:universal stress protein [candidate division KSB1 bacterium]